MTWTRLGPRPAMSWDSHQAAATIRIALKPRATDSAEDGPFP